MTTAEKIQSLVENLEQDARKATVRDILIDLRESLKDTPAHERAGLQAAIEIIDSNYDH